MMPEWWNKPRTISVLVDNESWILPYAEELVKSCLKRGDKASLVRAFDDLRESDITFFLGCVRIAPKSVLEKSKKNLVVHESNLPSGKGFSPMTWQILEGASDIVFCLLEASDKVDSGPVIMRKVVSLRGDELSPEWRHIQGETTVEICLSYLEESEIPLAQEQVGKESFYRRRNSADSEIDPFKTIAEQFDLLRVVNNDDYPAFFDIRGERYILRIDKLKDKIT